MTMAIEYGPNINSINLGSPTTWMHREGSSYLACQMTSIEPENGVVLTGIDSSLICGSVEAVTLISPPVNIPNVKQILGLLRSSLVFPRHRRLDLLHRHQIHEQRFVVHAALLYPYDMADGSRSNHQHCVKSIVAFGRGEQLIIFHGFLDFEEKVVFNENDLVEETIKLGLSKSRSWGADLL